MDESILNTAKKMLGIMPEYTNFDIDIIMHINTVLMILSQVGVGPSSGFRIEDESAIWGDFIDEDDNLNAVISYIYLKVRLLFDPPLNSAIIDIMKQNLTELEWRLNIQSEE